ncbi:hypothetical protein ACP4OV_024130 [Aristida adscensionis]
MKRQRVIGDGDSDSLSSESEEEVVMEAEEEEVVGEAEEEEVVMEAEEEEVVMEAEEEEVVGEEEEEEEVAAAAAAAAGDLQAEFDLHIPDANICDDDPDNPSIIISSADDLLAVEIRPSRYEHINSLEIRRARLTDAPAMLRRIRRMKSGDNVRVTNLTRLRQGADLHGSLSHLAALLETVYKGFMSHVFIWEIIEDVQALGPLHSDLQPPDLREGIESLLKAMEDTLHTLPEVPANRHSGLNTAPAPNYTPDTFTELAERVGSLLDTIASAQDRVLVYPDGGLLAFENREVLDEEPEATTCTRIRGIDHCRVLPGNLFLEEVYVSQLYLSDATAMAQILTGKRDDLSWSVGNLERVEEASALRISLITVSDSLVTIRNDLEAGNISWDDIETLTEILPTLPLCELQSAVFRDRALTVIQLLSEMLDMLPSAPPQQAPQDVCSPQSAPGPINIHDMKSLSDAVNNLQRAISDLCSTRI